VAQVGPSPSPNFGMGINSVPAHQVFVKMAKRKLLWKFEMIFGGV
jgi:hypothetical protein